jgi:CubicO group peptidase (beta-lactamase class C family)
MPTKDISALATDFPGTIVSQFGAGITPAHMTAYGYVINGFNYQGGYVTRNGVYPYKAYMIFPSYSTSKSFFASAGVMRFSQKYPAYGIYERFITPLVPQCPAAKWSDVSIHNAVDMATGNYGLAGFEADEASVATENGYFLKETQAERLSYACNQYSRKKVPGTFWNYHTTDTHIVTAALAAAVASQQAGVTVEKFLETELYVPLKLSPVIYKPKVTYDSVKAAWGSYGAYMSSDDLAKLGKFMNDDEGKIGGTPYLDYAHLKMGLQRDPANTGLTVTVPNQSLNHKYKHNFWAKEMYGGLYPGCNAQFTPYMSGYGGISVVLIKNKSTYYTVSDNGEYEWVAAVLEASAHVRSPCAVTYSP